MLRVAFLMVIVLFGCCLSTRSGVTITIGTGEKVNIRVELADTPEERARGLMFRHYLPEGEGMLFIFPEETRSSFWMKDTPISLDLVFIKEERIVDIIENAVPNSETGRKGDCDLVWRA